MAVGRFVKSIKQKLMVYFVFIIIITVVILEVFFINVVRQNYYNNLELALYNQIKVSADMYTRLFSDSSLYDTVINNVDLFWKDSTAQVEILDNNGKFLMDSIGIIQKDVSQMEDVRQAMKGQTGTWIGKTGDNESVMAMSYPVRFQDKTLGILRFITSLNPVNKEINKLAIVFICIGLAVILISIAVSIYMAQTIVGPLKEVTGAAEKMAGGNFRVQSKKKYDDEIGKLSDTLNYMAQEILKKDQLKNEFISSVSHELRTPLTSIKGWSVTLKSGNLEDKEIIMDGLDIIEKESDRLTTMVEELLDFSKFVSGIITVKRLNVDIRRVLEQIRKQMLPRAQRDNIEFIVRYAEDMPNMVSDENRLKQLFINILDNSFNFTSSGGRVEFTANFANQQFLFCIEDTGCGISEEELPKVKEKFYKGKSSKSQNGIGLSICDEIVKLMEGSWELQSEVNKGTRVCITIPLLKEGEM